MAKIIERRIVNAKTSSLASTNHTNKKRVVAYCRVSSLTEEQKLSFEAQKRYYETILGNAQDKILIRVYGDEGISGLRAAKRPQFQAMIEECRKGNIDEIYTKSVSRFARNYSECLEYARELKALRICIHFEKEEFTTFDENIEIYFGVIAILAQEESNSISQALNWTIKERRKHGDPILPACYGYKRDQKATNGIHKWHIIEEEAQRIRLIFKHYLSGSSIAIIAQRLNKFEKNNNRQEHWTIARIRRVLNNVAYIGDLHCGLYYTADYLSKKIKKNNGERESYYISKHHEPIITKDIFEQVQAIIEIKRRD